MRALITGINGFVGKHLAAFLINQGHQVWGTTRVVPHFKDNNNIHIIQSALDDAEKMKSILNQVLPDQIYHLAGQSNVRYSWENKSETFDANVIKTINLFEAILQSDVRNHTRVLTIGSSEEYGLIEDLLSPISENTLLNPISPYGISKATVSMLSKHYNNQHSIKTIHVRPFNHIGPGQGLGFVTSDFAKQISEIEKGIKSPIIMVGNLDAKRDFTDVRDIVNAYYLLLEQGDFGKVYNVCSGVPVSIQKILEKLISISFCSNIQIQKDETKIRPSDFPLYYGDPQLIRKKTNWVPSISLEDSLSNIIQYWRNRI